MTYLKIYRYWEDSTGKCWDGHFISKVYAYDLKTSEFLVYDDGMLSSSDDYTPHFEWIRPTEIIEDIDGKPMCIAEPYEDDVHNEKKYDEPVYTLSEVAEMFYSYTGKDVPCNGSMKDGWCRLNCNDDHPAYGNEEKTIDQKGIECWKHAIKEGWLND